jgi:pimeloyl-ACP methyl ester carboxylesterase
MCSVIPNLLCESTRNVLDAIQDYVFFRPSQTAKDHVYRFGIGNHDNMHSSTWEEVYLTPLLRTKKTASQKASKPLCIHGVYFHATAPSVASSAAQYSDKCSAQNSDRNNDKNTDSCNDDKNEPKKFKQRSITAATTTTQPQQQHRSLSAKGVVLVWHGNSGTLEQWGSFHTAFTSRGYDCLIMDYRSFGKSGGTLTESNLFADGLLAYDHLKSHYGFHDSQIILHGVSIGTTIAIYVAMKRPRCRFLVLEMPFFNALDLVHEYLPLSRNLGMLGQYLKYNFRNDQHLSQVKCPVYGIHATNDHIIPYSSAQKLFSLVEKRSNCFLYTLFYGQHCVANTASYQLFMNTIYD